nr:MAK10-like protein [Tanacetum cinerariifolium]
MGCIFSYGAKRGTSWTIEEECVIESLIMKGSLSWIRFAAVTGIWSGDLRLHVDRPSHEGYRNTIEFPDGNNVAPLRSDTIRLVQNGC